MASGRHNGGTKMRLHVSRLSRGQLSPLLSDAHGLDRRRGSVARLPGRARWVRLRRVGCSSGKGVGERSGVGADEDTTAAIASIAIPTFVALAVDPVAGLLDTAFLGHLGSAELAGAGVSLSFFATTTKLINVPLLAVTTSAVGGAVGTSGEADDISRTAASVLVTAIAVGIVQAVLLSGGTQLGLQAWGLDVSSSAYDAGQEFLQARAWGAPVTTMLLVSQGVFRGLGDAKMPLKAAVIACSLNALLDPLLMFTFGLGARGAAWATVAAEGAAVAFLVSDLVGKYDLTKVDESFASDILELVRPTGYLMLRTAALSGTLAYATGVSARISVEATASFEICFQIWLASSLLADALAVAVQTVLARGRGTGGASSACMVVDRSLQLGGLLGIGLGGVLLLVRDPLLGLFSEQDVVLRQASQSLVYAAAIQPLTTLAFVWDGVLFGADAFWYAALAMPFCVAPSVAIMYGALMSDSSVESRMASIWLALAVLMGMRSVAAYIPYRLNIGPFKGAEFSTRQQKG